MKPFKSVINIDNILKKEQNNNIVKLEQNNNKRIPLYFHSRYR